MVRYVKLSLFILIAGISAISVSAQSPLEASELRLRYDIGALAHDSMFGRESGTKAGYRAALFIEKSFRDSHLLPLDKTTGSYLRPFSFGDYHYKNSKLEINGLEFTPAVDYGAVAGTADAVDWKGKLDALDDFRAMKLSASAVGKAILLNLQGDRRGNSLNRTELISAIHELAANGAGCIFLSNAPKKMFSEVLFNADSMPSLPVPVLYVTRRVLDKVSATKECECKLSIQVDRDRKTAYNVIGFLDNKASKTIVIGGHYDHVGTPGSDEPVIGDPKIHNGADDNASGAAGVMELARWLSGQKSLKYNFLFIGFAAEEKGLFGSWNFCNGDDFKRFNIAWMLNLDMIGRLGWSGKNRVDVLGLASARQWKKILKKVDHSGLKFTKLGGGAAFSDHYPFRKHKVPFIYFTTGLEHEYHKPVDDQELINYKGEAMILDYIERLIIESERSAEPEYRKIGFLKDVGTVLKMFIFKL